jgi:hypothetical protein
VSEGELFLAGIAPEHVPALVAALLLPALVLGYRRLAGRTSEVGVILRADAPAPIPAPARVRRVVPVDERVAAWLLGVAAIVHLALPLGHHDDAGLTVAFLVDGAAFGWLALRAAAGRRWRPLAAPLVLATLVGYLVVLVRGGEEPDQVGIATAMVELAVLGLSLVPAATPGRRRRVARVFGGAALMLFTVPFGAVTWGVSFAAHADAVANQADPTAGHTAHAAHAHQGHAAHAARAQAGVLMLPVAAQPTAEQQRAAADLAARTRASLQRYTDIHAALATGYRPTLARTGYSVHLESKAAGLDRRILDPEHPEMLMYAIADGRATLLSAVFTMPRAGQAGPDPGGPLTRWHSHNACVSLLPPGFSVVDVYGGCPAFSVQVTMPVMMHLWVVDNPGGPYADHVPDAWTKAFNAAHGVPFRWKT